MRLELGKDLPTLKAHAKRRIDAEAEQIRLRYVTPGSAQAMVYLVKEAEARACLADPDADPDDYPLLAATVGIERNPATGEVAQDVTEVAEIVLAMAGAWAQAAAAIEHTRLAAKAAVEAADTPQAVEAAATVE